MKLKIKSFNDNNSYPGGLGPETFITFAKTTYDVDITKDKAIELKKLWLDAFPEMVDYLKPKLDLEWTKKNIRQFIKKHIKKFVNKEEAFKVNTLSEMEWFLETEGWSKKDIDSARFLSQVYMADTATGRIKRNCTFCASLNYSFQGLASDGGKIALWMLYDKGYKLTNWIHDEAIIELSEDEHLQDNVKQVMQVMVDAMSIAIPHVKIRVEGALMYRWYKEAKAIYDEKGNLLVWTPELAEKYAQK